MLRYFPLFASLMLCACAVYKDVSYFSPVPRQDIRVAATFRGLNEKVKFQLTEAIDLSLIIFDQPKKSSLRMIFHLPAGEVARFESADLMATPYAGTGGSVAKITTIQANYIVDGRGTFRYFSIGDDLEGASYEYKKAFGGVATVHRSFEIEVEFSDRLPDQFQLHLPQLKLSGKSVSLPMVEFRRMAGAAYQGSPP